MTSSDNQNHLSMDVSLSDSTNQQSSNVNEQDNTTNSYVKRVTRFIFPFKRKNPRAVSTTKANVDSLINTNCESCNLSDEQAFYDWELVNPNVLRTARGFREEHKLWNSDKVLKTKIYTIKKGYLTLRLNHLNNQSIINSVLESFDKALKECNPIRLIEAYSKEQAFSKLLNKDMARIVQHDIHQGCTKFSCDTLYTTEDGTKSIATILFYSPAFTTYQGKVYRGLCIPSELMHIQPDCYIMTSTFLSTSKSPDVANMFSGYNSSERKLDQEGTVSIFCTFTIKNTNGHRRALDISGISLRPNEEEVLLLPYSVFRVTKRETIELQNQRGKRIEIEFEECDEEQVKSSVSQQ